MRKGRPEIFYSFYFLPGTNMWYEKVLGGEGELCKHRHKPHHYSCFYLKLPIMRVILSEFVSEFQFHMLTIYSCLKITFG